MQLVMFDIDGTLTETMKVDEECLVRSFVEVFGFTDIETDWSHYPHVTDSGIFHEVYAPFAGTVYVGDGVWDARACRALSIPFIGIGSGVRAARLALEGAVRVFQDFSEEELFLETLDRLSRKSYGAKHRD